MTWAGFSLWDRRRKTSLPDAQRHGTTPPPMVLLSPASVFATVTGATHSPACFGPCGSGPSRRTSSPSSPMNDGLAATCSDTERVTGGATRTWKNPCTRTTTHAPSVIWNSSRLPARNGEKASGPTMLGWPNGARRRPNAKQTSEGPKNGASHCQPSPESN